MNWYKFIAVFAIFFSFIWIFPIAKISITYKIIDTIGAALGVFIALEYGAIGKKH